MYQTANFLYMLLSAFKFLYFHKNLSVKQDIMMPLQGSISSLLKAGVAVPGGDSEGETS